MHPEAGLFGPMTTYDVRTRPVFQSMTPRWWDAEDAALVGTDPYEFETDRATAEHGVLAGLLDDPYELSDALAAEAPYVDDDVFGDELAALRTARSLSWADIEDAEGWAA